MIVEIGTITLYTIVHDWFPLGAIVIGSYKLWEYLKNFKSDIQKEVKGAKADMLASNVSLEKNLTSNSESLEKAVNTQTSSLVSEFQEMRADLRAYLSVLSSPMVTTVTTGHRTARAAKTKKKD
jgi:hypothetical protein